MTYISKELRSLVRTRARNRCEYCLMSQTDLLFTFEIEHVIAEKRGGRTNADNLALSCPHCNKHKGSDIASEDPENGELARLYNPRTQKWDDHFHLEGDSIVGLSPEGRVTVRILQFNAVEHLDHRAALILMGAYPKTL